MVGWSPGLGRTVLLLGLLLGLPACLAVAAPPDADDTVAVANLAIDADVVTLSAQQLVFEGNVILRAERLGLERQYLLATAARATVVLGEPEAGQATVAKVFAAGGVQGQITQLEPLTGRRQHAVIDAERMEYQATDEMVRFTPAAARTVHAVLSGQEPAPPAAAAAAEPSGPRTYRLDLQLRRSAAVNIASLLAPEPGDPTAPTPAAPGPSPALQLPATSNARVVADTLDVNHDRLLRLTGAVEVQAEAVDQRPQYVLLRAPSVLLEPDAGAGALALRRAEATGPVHVEHTQVRDNGETWFTVVDSGSATYDGATEILTLLPTDSEPVHTVVRMARPPAEPASAETEPRLTEVLNGRARQSARVHLGRTDATADSTAPGVPTPEPEPEPEPAPGAGA